MTSSLFLVFFFSFPFFAAIDLINNLLQVKMRKRYSVDKTLSHPWLQVRLWTKPELNPFFIIIIISLKVLNGGEFKVGQLNVSLILH